MKQIFRPNANLFALVSIVAVVYIAVGALWVLYVLDRSNYARRVNIPIEQPVPYSHQLHAGSLGMDCRYCHSGAQVSAYAPIPATETCMTCHHEIKANSTLLTPVRDSYQNDLPVQWNKVHDVPDFVYFNHSAHLSSGVGCSECHGRVDQMEVVYKANSMTMGWCLNCHRNPEQYVRPREEVWNIAYEHPADQLALGQRLVEEYNINKRNLEQCYTCHR